MTDLERAEADHDAARELLREAAERVRALGGRVKQCGCHMRARYERDHEGVAGAVEYVRAAGRAVSARDCRRSAAGVVEGLTHTAAMHRLDAAASNRLVNKLIDSDPTTGRRRVLFVAAPE